jgi:hypothetical protein
LTEFKSDMSSSVVKSISQGQVYLGVWTNWSHGSVDGLTLTLTHRSGGFLIAFIAIFTAVTGNSLWRIMSYTIHQYLSQQGPQDALYHQRQAILRNSSTGASAFYKQSRLLWAWRKSNVNGYRRIPPVLILSGLVTLGFAVASVFSSRLATFTNGEVLLSSSKCGLLSQNLATQLSDFGIEQSYIQEGIIFSSNYARSCYTDKTPRNMDQACSTSPKVSLPYKVAKNQGCPFSDYPDICREETNTIQFDSKVNSHFDLGINAAPKDRFDFRLLVQCAPLRNNGFTENTTSSYSVNDPFINFNFGSYGGQSGNTTFQYPATAPIVPNPSGNTTYSNINYMVT